MNRLYKNVTSLKKKIKKIRLKSKIVRWFFRFWIFVGDGRLYRRCKLQPPIKNLYTVQFLLFKTTAAKRFFEKFALVVEISIISLSTFFFFTGNAGRLLELRNIQSYLIVSKLTSKNNVQSSLLAAKFLQFLVFKTKQN